MVTKKGDISPLPDSHGESSRAFESDKHHEEFSAAAKIITQPIESSETIKKANYASFTLSGDTAGETIFMPDRNRQEGFIDVRMSQFSDLAVGLHDRLEGI